MTRLVAAVAVLAVVASLGLAGVTAPAVAQDVPGNETVGNETAHDGDVPDEYLTEIEDGVYITDYQFRESTVVVDFYIAEGAPPVTVDYADVGSSVEGEPGVRTPATQREALVRSGEHSVELPAGDGPSGQMTMISVDGQPVVIEGEGTSSTSILTVIGPTPALILGAIAGVAVAGYVAYRNKQEQLEEPVKARDVWKRK